MKIFCSSIKNMAEARPPFLGSIAQKHSSWLNMDHLLKSSGGGGGLSGLSDKSAVKNDSAVKSRPPSLVSEKILRKNSSWLNMAYFRKRSSGRLSDKSAVKNDSFWILSQSGSLSSLLFDRENPPNSVSLPYFSITFGMCHLPPIGVLFAHFTRDPDRRSKLNSEFHK
jgi:hypothetical protein